MVSVHPVSTSWPDGISALIGLLLSSSCALVIIQVGFVIGRGQDLQTGVTVGKIVNVLQATFPLTLFFMVLVSPTSYY